MPVVNNNTCKWCGTNTRTFNCGNCGERTCGECLVWYSEDGTCHHVKFDPPVTTAWDEEQLLEQQVRE